jgi:hypothetical protein
LTFYRILAGSVFAYVSEAWTIKRLTRRVIHIQNYIYEENCMLLIHKQNEEILEALQIRPVIKSYRIAELILNNMYVLRQIKQTRLTRTEVWEDR